MPAVSIAVPIYNVEKYLTQCIDSVLVQTFTDFELLLIDDGSPDRCGAICDQYAEQDERIIVFHGKNKGLSAARNIGIQNARGKYLIFIDPDDYWLQDDFLEKVYFEIDEYNVDMVIFKYIRFIDQSSKFKTFPPDYMIEKINDKPPEQTIPYLVNSDQFEISACFRMVRREIIVKNGLLFDESRSSSEDIDWGIALSMCVHCIRALNYPVYVYRLRKHSQSTGVPGGWEQRYKVISKWYAILKNNDVKGAIKNSLLGFLAYQYYIMLGSMAEGNREQRKLAYRKARELKDVIQYDVSKKTHISKIIVQLFGIRLSAFIFNLYRKRKQ